MKRIGYLFNKICEIDNIKLAIMKASLGKRRRPFVREIINDIDEYASVIQKMLVNKEYQPSRYRVTNILDGACKKERVIHVPRFFPDQVIHWALMLQIESVIMRGMYTFSCGSIPGRGTSYAQKYLRKWIDSDYRGTKYCLKMDISKFYPSVNQTILKGMFRKIIKDKDCLWLIDTIIESVESGLPIGNYTSQWFSNYFLQGLDHYIKKDLSAKYYIRYIDDLVILGGNKREMHKIRNGIAAYLANMDLKMKDNWQVFKIDSRDIDFLGFRFYRNKTTLRKRNALRIRRRMVKISRKDQLNFHDACAVVSYWGWIKRSNSFNFYCRLVRPYVNIQTAKRRISYYAKTASL
ncbi:MAG TPA: RNA-directed DNA polymerase [Methanofastidiosum sp.]|nr:RNA-directed DNA polymerase [Methanofastidiosum sp.]